MKFGKNQAKIQNLTKIGNLTKNTNLDKNTKFDKNTKSEKIRNLTKIRNFKKYKICQRLRNFTKYANFDKKIEKRGLSKFLPFQIPQNHNFSIIFCYQKVQQNFDTLLRRIAEKVVFRKVTLIIKILKLKISMSNPW